MSSQALISVNNLVRYYGDYCAVDNISFELAAGDILGFLGPNGAGKSTTMQILSGNLAPTEGEVHINGIDLLDKPGAAKAALGYLPEVPPLYKEMSVDEYLRYCAVLRRIKKAGIKDAMDLAKQRCGLANVGKRLIGNLSKGFQQRVGIAQAILHSPQVIILDEPTVGLDPIQIREIRDLITELGKSHGIILSTHILPEVESVCNRVQIINEGKLVYASDMQGLLEQQSTGKYEISLGSPPSLDEIRTTNFIDQVEQLDANHFIVHISTTADRLADVAVNNNWQLSKLVAHEHSLEQIFVNLTLGDGESV
jgi:ABC-2 type transport system ATP-binding protein